MQAEIENRIADYVHDHLSPKKDERTMISIRYNEVCQLLTGPVFQSGSYPRYTAITPVNDLDMIWQLPQSVLARLQSATVMFKAIDPNTLNIARILQDLAANLTEECRRAGINVRIRAQSHSVGVYFGDTDEEFSMDIVPAVPNGERNAYGDSFYLVPDIAMMKKSLRQVKYAAHTPITWLKSDPRGYKTAAEELNEKTPSYRKATKVVKAWKRACRSRNPIFPLKSFHLEMVVHSITERDTSLNTVAALQQTFDVLPQCLEIPRFPDRADDKRFIDEYVRDIDRSVRLIVRSEIAQASTIMTQIANETDPDKAERALRRLIGHPSPSPVSPLWIAPATSKPYYADYK